MSDTKTTLEAELVVGGMTCGSCAARIERRLNRLDGVAATVNYATRRAYFSSLGGRDARELIEVGAYAPGSDPDVDVAIRLRPHLEEFLRQGPDEVEQPEIAERRLATMLGL